MDSLVSVLLHLRSASSHLSTALMLCVDCGLSEDAKDVFCNIVSVIDSLVEALEK